MIRERQHAPGDEPARVGAQEGDDSRHLLRPPQPRKSQVVLRDLFAEYDLPVPATDCRHCLTQSCEADLAVLDPARYGRGAAGQADWNHRHAGAKEAAG